MKYGENVIQAFLMYSKNQDIANAIGKSIRMVQNYKNDPELQKIVSERRIEYVKTSVSKMQCSMNHAVDVLNQIIDDPDTSSQTKVNAINILFNQCRDWTQGVDVLERIQRIESERGIDNE